MKFETIFKKAGGSMFQFSEKTKGTLHLESFKKTKIVVPCKLKDFQNIFVIYEVGDYFLVHIVEEFVAFGTASADWINDRWLIEPTEWIRAQTEQHWEGGIVYEILPQRTNFAKYLLEIPFPAGFQPIRNMVYRDWLTDYPDNTGARDIGVPT